MEWNYAETTGAQSFISTTDDAERPAAPTAQPFRFTYGESIEAPALTIIINDNRLLDVLQVMVSIAEQGSAIKPSAFYDSFLKHGRFLVMFVVFLLGRYVSHIPLYLVFFSISLISLSFLYVYIHYVPFLFLQEDIMWIRRESRLLNAISEDTAKVAGLRDQIDTRAKEILDPSIYSGGATIEGLNYVEAEWVAKTRSVVKRANALVATFENQRRRDSHMIHRICFGTISEKVKQVEWLLTETKQVKEEINERIKMKADRGINICESLERSRSEMRSLVDRPIYESSHQQKWVESKRRVETSAALTFSITKKMNSLMTQEPDEQIHSIYLQLMLLYPFLKDIEEVRFESEIEEAWVEEMEEVINQTQPAIESFLLQRPEHRFKWLSIIDNWKAWRKLKEDIRCIDSRFTELLERKERYGFRFIRRDSSKFVNQSPHHNTPDGIISPVAGTIHSYLEAKPDISREIHGKLGLLCTHLDDMNKLVDDAEMIERRYISRMAWLEQMSNIVKRAENSVQTFMKSSKNVRIKQIQFRTNAGTNLWREIGQMENTVNLVTRTIKAYNIKFTKESNSVVGLEEDVHELVSRLTTYNEHHPFFSILGIGGIGKTTLAKEIYNHADVATHFPQRVWISLPWKSSESWVQTVPKNVRYLLVLENISTKEELEEALTVASPSGSRILLTTRDTNLVSEVGNPPHHLRLRTKEESWKLLNKMVHFNLKEEVKAKEILGKCGGFPLAIVRLGYLISRTAVYNFEELERVIKQKEKPMLETYPTIESIQGSLPKSDPHMFRCLSYLKLFPMGIEIPARRLIALWIAEGLVKVEKKTESPESEDVANEYLTELINRDMIQVVERKLNGTIKTCCLPYSLQKLEFYKNQKRIVNFRRNDPSPTSGKSSNFRNDYRDLLSILTFDTREGNTPGEEAGNFLRKGIAGGCFRKLQVLDLERLFRPELPNMLGPLSKLRYLGLRWTCLGSIPSSIGELVNLQTLDVKHTSVRNLPGSIWKLQELRNLYLNQNCRSRLEHHQGGNSLKNLRTLWGLFVDKDSPLKDGLDKVTNLRKLGLAFQLEQEEQKALANWIKKLKYLKSLRIRSIGEKGKPCDLMCMPLSGLNHLSSLNLFGKLTSSIIAEFPKNLTDLTLSASSLIDDPMPKLEKLSNLKLLCFYSNSYRGKGMRCAAEGFPQLLVLRLWNLVELEVWDVEEKAMQNLRELEIRSCKNLKIPTGLGHLKTLLELKVTDMPRDFAVDIAKNKRQLWDDVVHSPAIIAAK
ncbi:PREDICTED: probable disease resistance protein RF9 [Prunus mume]|uniref:Probable disease resistance protein RF9 n=1 Tax=Prunus mume TaxID=102107 RepID=A0ABM0NQM6_PRUMU|nr:PREDICTED: probable disease resistance protein RF9 [Prunus mume]